jgi:uncharacterized protein (UPF0303 family)
MKKYNIISMLQTVGFLLFDVNKDGSALKNSKWIKTKVYFFYIASITCVCRLPLSLFFDQRDPRQLYIGKY